MVKKFRGKFLRYLSEAVLDCCGATAHLKDAGQFHNLIASLYRKDWYAYCKRPFKTTACVLEYLGRYTHRIAISNHRIIGCDKGQVSFKWRDYRNGGKEKVMVLPAEEFIRRFLLHILPPQFTKIRHYGFLASAVKKEKLSLCKKLTSCNVYAKNVKPDTIELIKRLTGIDITLCPVCGSMLTRASPESLIA
jgi:hypothetical protein